MDTHQLSAFIAVAESGSFSLAANELHLTQPAISKRIAILEGQLGAQLFDRIGKQVKLTEAGQLLLPRAINVLQELRDTRIAIQNLNEEVSGSLSLAASHHIGLRRLPPVLKAYSKTYPKVNIDISFLDSEEAYNKVLHGDLELAVVTLAIKKLDRIQQTSLWPDPLCFTTSRDHPLAREKTISLQQLLTYPAILPGENTFTRQKVEQAFAKKRLVLNIESSTNYLETIKMMVSIGMAWSVLPETMLDDTVIKIPVQDMSISRSLGYILHKDHTLSNAGRSFINLLENGAVN